MSLSHKTLYKWPVNLWRVSLPLKFKKTSYSHWWVEEEVEVIGVYIRVEDWDGQRCDKMGIIRDEWTHEKKIIFFITGGWRWWLCGSFNIAPPSPFGKEVMTEDEYPQKYYNFHAFLKHKMFESNVFSFWFLNQYR